MSINTVDLSASTFPISHVTLYTARAEIKRTVNCSVKKEENEVVISDLPSNIVLDSLKSAVEGAGHAQIILKHVALTTSPIFRPILRSDSLAALEKEKQELNDAKSRLQERIQILVAYTKAITPRDVNPDQLASIIGFQSKERALMDDEYREINEKLQTCSKSITAETDKINRQEMEKLQGKSDMLRSQAKIGVWAADDTEVQLTMTYAVNDASWEPLYDGRITTLLAKQGEKPVRLTYKAKISQHTGEDWRAVSVTLSTSQPSFSNVPPTLDPWPISFHRPAAKEVQGGVDNAEREESDEDMGFGLFDDDAPLPHQATMATASVRQQSHLSATFDVPGTTTILTGGSTLSQRKERTKTVTIAELGLNAALEWIAVPRKMPKVYLNSKVKNSSDYQLLSGPIAVYLDGSFVANSTLRDVSVNEEFLIHLGVDSSVRLVYHPLVKRVFTTGILSRMKVQAFSQRTFIHNTKGTRIAIHIKDQVPVSQDENLIVRLTLPVLAEDGTWTDCGKGIYASRVKGEDGEKGMGAIEWKVDLEPGAKMTLAYDWEVAAPVAERKIVGLDRAEGSFDLYN
ncbi:hypothetical protein BT69DRAFT_1350011 [Atractiella rhizophila]|nr:hypothetical protein BT69DRAFT_1350011 [Atractiella rhizophila]